MSPTIVQSGFPEVVAEEEEHKEEEKLIAEVVKSDPKERDLLPYFKDPNMKVSMYALVKDSVGKDFSKMSVPVYFNEPLNLLQKAAQYNEYTDVLDKACQEKDQLKRLAYVAAWSATELQSIEKSSLKPFNPLLGETFEMICEDKEFISEQVSHHPPVSASFCRGLKSNWVVWANHKTSSKFTGKTIEMTQQFNTYVELLDFQETYEITPPQMGAHNLVIGTPYMDIGGISNIRLLSNTEIQAKIKYIKRGLFSKEECKIEGEVSKKSAGAKKSKNEPIYKLQGHWNKRISVVGVQDGEAEVVYQKNKYPEKESYMYGMTHFSLQLNYLPDHLKPLLPHTDTRFRQDQRCLENGDLIMAAKEKDRLEIKQRRARKQKEAQGQAHTPAYFEEVLNPADNQTYFKYNYKYFEEDRKNKEWSRLPDLFSEKMPEILDEEEKQI